MFSLARKNLWSHKRRLISTTLAVVLGIAFLSGTLVLGDTMRSTFDDIFTQSNAGTAAVIRAHSTSTELDHPRPLLDGSLVDQVRHVDGVVVLGHVWDASDQTSAHSRRTIVEREIHHHLETRLDRGFRRTVGETFREALLARRR